MNRRSYFRRDAAAVSDSQWPEGMVHPAPSDFQSQPGAPGARSAAPGPSRGASATVLQAERDVVGALLADNSLFDQVGEILRASDFVDAAARGAFSAVAAILDGRIDGVTLADPVTVSAQPEAAKWLSLDDLFQLASCADTRVESVSARARVIQDAAAERELSQAVTRAGQIATEERPLQERAGEIQQIISGAGESRALPVISMGAAAIKALNGIAERAAKGQTGIRMPYGYRDLDALTAGLHPGELVILAARPGIGKTALALSSGMHIAQLGFHVLVASMEMLAEELSKRALSMLSGVDGHAIRLGALSEQQWVDVVGAAEKLVEIPFDIVDVPSVTLAALTAVCRRMKRAGKLDLLIVDYLQIMAPSGNKATREQQVAELSRGLKELAKALEIPVIALSQLNRAVEHRLDKRPVMADLRESGAVEQDADVIIFIYREDAADGVEAVSKAELIVAKQRAGAVGTCEVLYRKPLTRFDDVPAAVAEHAEAAANDPLRSAAA